jgi:hypothetical protein
MAVEEDDTDSGWAELCRGICWRRYWEAAGQNGPQDWSGCEASAAAARLVCSGWKYRHDALVMRLVLRKKATDEGVRMLVRRFPAVSSLDLGYHGLNKLTNDGLRTVIK